MPVSRKKFLILSLSLSPLCCLYFAIVVFLLKVELFFTCKVHHIHIHHYHHPPPYYHHCTTSCRFKMNAFVDFSLPTTTIFEISQLCFVWLGFFYDFQNSISTKYRLRVTLLSYAKIYYCYSCCCCCELFVVPGGTQKLTKVFITIFFSFFFCWTYQFFHQFLAVQIAVAQVPTSSTKGLMERKAITHFLSFKSSKKALFVFAGKLFSIWGSNTVNTILLVLKLVFC